VKTYTNEYHRDRNSACVTSRVNIYDRCRPARALEEPTVLFAFGGSGSGPIYLIQNINSLALDFHKNLLFERQSSKPLNAQGNRKDCGLMFLLICRLFSSPSEPVVRLQIFGKSLAALSSKNLFVFFVTKSLFQRAVPFALQQLLFKHSSGSFPRCVQSKANRSQGCLRLGYAICAEG